MTFLTSIVVGVLFATSAYLLLSRELKAVAMGVFLLGHGANLAILTVSGSPAEGARPPILGEGGTILGGEVDPLPQALVLTAIVIGFAVQAFLLTMIVVTWRRTRTLELRELSGGPTPVEPGMLPHDARLHRLKEMDPAEPGADPALHPPADATSDPAPDAHGAFSAEPDPPKA